MNSPLINTTSQLSHLQNKDSNLRPAAQQFYRPPTAICRCRCFIKFTRLFVSLRKLRINIKRHGDHISTVAFWIFAQE